MPYLLPDKKTFVYTTDVADWLVFDHDELTTSGIFEWNKKDYGNILTGATHIVNDVGSPNTIGMVTQLDSKKLGGVNLWFYKITPDDVHTKVKIGKLEFGSMPYYHSFGHTEEYLLFARNSVGFNTAGMFEGHP